MKSYLNLLPWKIQCRLLFRQRLRQWILCWAVLGGLAVLLVGQSWTSLASAHEELATWQRRAVAVQAVQEKNSALQRKTRELKERLEKYGHLNSEQIGFQLLATISQSSSSVDGKIQIQKLGFRQFQVAEAPVAKAGNPPPNPPSTNGKPVPPVMRDVRTLSLSGVAANNLAVAQFVSALRDSGAFQKVDLKSSQGNKSASDNSRNFQVECSF